MKRNPLSHLKTTSDKRNIFQKLFNARIYLAVTAVCGAAVTLLCLSGCELSYLIRSADGQLNLLSKKVSLERALADPHIDDETKRKIRLSQEVKKFAEEKLSLAHSKNYESFVLLQDRYVTYAVTAAKKNELKAHLWNFPFVGSVPYKGFFKKDDATKEADLLRAQELDVMVRGVSAYSTLGWFSDPLLSSMTQDDDFSFVDTLIHESTHATIYIKSNANFNERLATFVGEKGAEEFFNLKEGSKSVTLEKARAERQDAKVFFSFMTEEIKKLEAFYKEKGHQPEILSLREQEFKNIHLRFVQNCRPKLKTKRFDFFSSMTLNNALLVGYSLYYSNLEIFEKLMAVSKNNWKSFFGYLNQVKDLKDPEEALTGLIVKEATVTSPSPSPSSPSPSS